MELLTKSHICFFVPRQMFEMSPPSGTSYNLELALDTFAELEAAIVLDEYPIKNLSFPNSPLSWVSFETFREMLKTLKTYQPCWTNTMERMTGGFGSDAEEYVLLVPNLHKKDVLLALISTQLEKSKSIAKDTPLKTFVSFEHEKQLEIIEEYKK